jgi:hypothetical protein
MADPPQQNEQKIPAAGDLKRGVYPTVHHSLMMPSLTLERPPKGMMM